MKISRIFLIIVFLLIIGCKREGEDLSLFIFLPGVEKEDKNLILNYYSNLNAKDFMKKESNLISILLEPRYDPYDGLENLPEKCLTKNIPGVISFEDDHQHYKLFSFYSADKNHLAECPHGKKLLKTQYLILYCKSRKSKNILKAKYFYGEDEKWLLKPLAKCYR